MADVTIRFLPPSEVGIVALRIYEGETAEGSFTQIDRTENIGVFPNYIGYYATAAAQSVQDFFAIAWEDENGSVSPMSEAIQGGTETLVGLLTNRVVLRMPSADENVVRQEAEVVIEDVLRVDPYNAATSVSVKYKQWSGMTYLVMVRVAMAQMMGQENSEQFTAGLVSMKTSNSVNMKEIQAWLTEANKMLGRGYSIVAQMTGPLLCGFSEVKMADISRLRIDVQ